MQFTRRYSTTALLTRQATCQVTESPFEEERLREQVVRALAEKGLHLDTQKTGKASLWTSGFSSSCSARRRNPEASLGDFPRGVRVGPGARLPRQTALFPAKKKWSLKEQYDGTDHLAPVDEEEAT